MKEKGSEIQDVSDTALWVAVYRALETERPDALFKDPLAAVLAGERGRRIAASMAASQLMAWAMAMRTSAIDRLVHSAIDLGADTVLNLGAGLDTRPYRMEGLPPGLRWIEVDFPHMVELKNQKLADQKPVCQFERVPLDLSLRSERQALLSRVAENAKRVLVITEGVIPYLEPEEVKRLAADLLAQPKIQNWIQDYAHAGHRRRMPRNWSTKLKLAPFKFATPDWFAFFAPLGWRPRDIVPMITESERVGRRPPFVLPQSLLWIAGYLFSPPSRRKKMREMIGITMLERA